MSPGTLPFISVEVLITALHFFSLPLALQTAVCFGFAGRCVEPHILFCYCSSPQELNRNFPLRVSYELTSYFISEQGNSVQSPTVTACVSLCPCRDKTSLSYANVKDSLQGCKGLQIQLHCRVIPLVVWVFCSSNPKCVGVISIGNLQWDVQGLCLKRSKFVVVGLKVVVPSRQMPPCLPPKTKLVCSVLLDVSSQQWGPSLGLRLAKLENRSIFILSIEIFSGFQLLKLMVHKECLLLK